MKIRTALSLLLAAALIGGLVAPSSLAAKKKKKSGPMVVATDPADDWGSNADGNLQPIGDGLGLELVEASIAMADASTINFILKVNGLPPTGGIPEIARYNWDFQADGVAYQLSGAFTEYLRGICNPNVTGACPPGPPRDPGSAPFFIRQGPCNVGAACEEIALVHATFDAAAGTITIPVPLETIEAKPGSKIGPGASSLGMPIYAALAAFVTYADLPNDQMMVTGTFVVPK